MRDSFNFDMLPIVQDNMNCFPGVKCLSSISSNGYYGYQAPPVDTKQKEDASPGGLVQSCDMDVQYFENFTSNQMVGSRKRSWECSNDLRDFKKRRQNESSPFIHQPPSAAPNRDVKLRKPTHNVPDMPRCIMGHYI